MRARPDLDKGDLARAHVALGVLDDHLAVVLQPALLTQHVVDAGHRLVPLVVIPVTEERATQGGKKRQPSIFLSRIISPN